MTESEAFFIQKINKGLEFEESPPLSEREERLLLVCSTVGFEEGDVVRLVGDWARQVGMSPDAFAEESEPTAARSIRALAWAYEADTWYHGTNATMQNLVLDNALDWRRHNGALYEFSRTSLSGVVQNWYLRAGGRYQEAALSPLTRKTPSWHVAGADRYTGRDIHMTIYAPDVRSAELFANVRGILVCKVEKGGRP